MITDRPNTGSYFVGLSFSKPFSVIGEYKDFAGGEKLDGSPVLDVSNLGYNIVENTDGSVDLNISWAWDNDGNTSTNDNVEIDGFRLFAAITDDIIDPTDDGFNDYVAANNSVVYADLDASARTFRAAGVAADKYYTIGIYAYRVVFDAATPQSGAIKDGNVIRSPGEFIASFKPVEVVKINGVGVNVLTEAVNNFNTNNDRNAIVPKSPYNLSYTSFPNIDGSVDIEVSWYFNDTYASDVMSPDSDIDGFRLIAIGGDTAYTAPSLSHTYAAHNIIEVPFNKDAVLNRHVYRYRGVPINLFYVIGVYAYRMVDSDVLEAVAGSSKLGNCIVSNTVQYPNIGTQAFQISSTVNYQGNIGGIPLNNYTTIANNYFNANDRIATIPNGPSIPSISTTTATQQNEDGSSDVTVTWSYTYQFQTPSATQGSADYTRLTGNTDIDGFRIVLEHSNSAFTCSPMSQRMVTSAFNEIRSTRGLELSGVRKTLDGSGRCTVTYSMVLPGFPSGHKLCVGVFAYRAVAPDILDNIGSANRIVDAIVSNIAQYPSQGQSAHAIGTTPNYWGKVADTQAVTLVSTAKSAAADATFVKDVIGAMVADNQLSPIEKQQLKGIWDAFLAEKPKYQTQATAFGLNSAYFNNYNNAMIEVGTILNKGVTYSSGYPLLLTNNAADGLAVITDLTTIANGTSLLAKVQTLADYRAALAAAISDSLKGFADTAKTSADNAYALAGDVDDAVTDIISDSKFTPNEKATVRSTWDAIVSERSYIEAQADVFGVTSLKTTYSNSITALGTYLNNNVSWSSGIPGWISDANLSITTNIVGSTFRQKFTDFTTARTRLLNQIAEVSRVLAQSATDKIADMESDGKITPVEKQEIRRIWNSYYAEYGSLYALGTSYNVITERNDYANALNSLGTLLNGSSYSISATVPTHINDSNLVSTTTVTGSTLRSYFANFEAARTALINAFSGVAYNNANTATNKIAEMESDGWISPVEKSELRKMWDAYYAEYSSMTSTATTIGVATTTYTTQLNALGTYLNGSSYTISATVPTYINNSNLTTATAVAGSTLRSYVALVESARTALVNNFVTTANTKAIAAINSVDGKLNADAADILSGTISFSSAGGFKTGTISVDSAGNVTGAGVAFTSKGITGRNTSGNTFTINATTGDCTFSGNISTNGDAKFYGKDRATESVNIGGNYFSVDYSAMGQAIDAPTTSTGVRCGLYGYANATGYASVGVIGKAGATGGNYGVIGDAFIGVAGTSTAVNGIAIYGAATADAHALYTDGKSKLVGAVEVGGILTLSGGNYLSFSGISAVTKTNPVIENYIPVKINGNLRYLPICF